MARLTTKEIKDLARSLIAQNPGGIRYSVLVDKIWQLAPETPKNKVHGSVWDLDARFPNEVAKPSRGLFAPAVKSGNELPAPETADNISVTTGRMQESDFYEPFALWLKNDLEEVTKVVPLGGAGLKLKWATPDVVGTYKPLAGNLIKFPIEIVSGEIKIDAQTQASVVAFGQAVAYRLFSTKTYIAMPTALSEVDQARLESLCMLFGVGLVLFQLNKDDPQFSIRVRAQRFSPDMFYVNEFADGLRKHNSNVFEELFG